MAESSDTKFLNNYRRAVDIFSADANWNPTNTLIATLMMKAQLTDGLAKQRSELATFKNCLATFKSELAKQRSELATFKSELAKSANGNTKFTTKLTD